MKDWKNLKKKMRKKSRKERQKEEGTQIVIGQTKESKAYIGVGRDPHQAKTTNFQS